MMASFILASTMIDTPSSKWPKVHCHKVTYISRTLLVPHAAAAMLPHIYCRADAKGRQGLDTIW